MSSWFTKHRPWSFSQLHRQPVRDQLMRLLKSKPFPQVLLFAGSRGTGKTTAARILAAVLNDASNKPSVEALFFSTSQTGATIAELQEPTWSDQTESIVHGKSFAVHEIDAASHRGIDDVRELRERLPIPPQVGTVAVYILDEVHMLTTEAFNALLKILEEPPAHVVFVLATTEPEKILPTIRSRCMEIVFSKPTAAEMVAALTTVADAEKITYTKPALQMIALQADGSFRDGVKLLQQISQSGDALTENVVEERLALPNIGLLVVLTQAVVAKDDVAVTQTCEQLRGRGYDSLQVRKAWLVWLHQQLLQSITSPKEASYSKRVVSYLLHYLDQLILTKHEAVPLLSLEVALLELVYKAIGKPQDPQKQPPQSQSSPKSAAPTIIETHEADRTENTNLSKPSTQENTSAVQKLLKEWENLVAKVKDTNSSLGAILQSAVPQPLNSTDTLTFGVYFPFHKEQLLHEKFRIVFDQVTQELSGQKVAYAVQILEREQDLVVSL